MTPRNWIATALLASFAAAGACSPQGGQAGQPDQALEERDRSDTGYAARDRDTSGGRGMTEDRNMEADRDTDRPASADLVSLTIPAGTRLHMVIDDELGSRKNKPGDTFTAKVDEAVHDAQGRVVVASGTKVNGIVVAVKPAPNRRTPGTLTLTLSTIEQNGQTYPLTAQIDEVTTERRRQPADAGDAGKVAAGAAAGAVIGQVLSKNTKGTVIGAVFGGLAGAGVAAETKDVDIVLPDGAHIQATITEPLAVSVDRDAARELGRDSNRNQKTDTSDSYRPDN
ncbi:MAG: glycine zipper 2TM domain-containing protein [Gemmatimonadales bacterium]